MTKKEIELQCDIAWAEKYLELTGHKIGDEVTCSFTCYFGNHKSSYMTSTDAKGVIVMTERGIRVKSNDKMKQAHEEKRRWNDRHTIWVYYDDYSYAKVNFIKED